MLFSLIVYLFYLVAGLALAIIMYKFLTKPEIAVKDDTVLIKLNQPPSPVDFYLRVIFAMNNLMKPGFLPTGRQIPKFEVVCKNAALPAEQLSKMLAVCGFDRKATEVPPTFPFAITLPLASAILTHAKYPMKALAATIHMKQTINLIRPVRKDENMSKKVLFQGGENTDRGTEFAVKLEVYSGNTVEKSSLIGNGWSHFLIVKKKKGAKPEEEKKETAPVTRSATFSVPADAGVRYAAASGDYNPWHLYAATAKLFGYRKPITQGYYSLGKCIAEIGADMPKYPLSLVADWKRPIFMPSRVTISISKVNENKVLFELHSEDKQHLHLVGSIEHNPNLEL